jgi:hypothetical protein
MSHSINDTAQHALDVLSRREPKAAFVTEIQATLRPPDELEKSLRQLADAELIILLAEPAPDPHLEHFDLRVAALIPDGDRAAALDAAREVWGGWVRQFLASHRCQ